MSRYPCLSEKTQCSPTVTPALVDMHSCIGAHVDVQWAASSLVYYWSCAVVSYVRTWWGTTRATRVHNVPVLIETESVVGTDGVLGGWFDSLE